MELNVTQMMTDPTQTQKQLLRIIAKTNVRHFTYQKQNNCANSEAQENLRESRRKKQNVIRMSNKKKKEQEKEVQKSKQKKARWWKKGLQCILQTFSLKAKQQEQSKIFVKCDSLLETLHKLRNSKERVNIKQLPELKEMNMKTLVIDLEGTLLYSSREELPDYDFKLDFQSENTEIRMYSKIRPGAQQFLQQISNIYEIILYTNCEQDHANAILQNISKPDQIKHRLYRQKCLNLNHINYLKQLRRLNRDPKKTIFLDYNVASGVLQPLNFHQVSRYKGNPQDRELEKVSGFLQWLAEKDDVMPVFRNYQQFLEERVDVRLTHMKKQDSGKEPIKRSLKLNRTVSFDNRLRPSIASRFRQSKICNQFDQNPISTRYKNEQRVKIDLDSNPKINIILSPRTQKQPVPTLDLNLKQKQKYKNPFEQITNRETNIDGNSEMDLIKTNRIHDSSLSFRKNHSQRGSDMELMVNRFAEDNHIQERDNQKSSSTGSQRKEKLIETVVIPIL